MKEVTPDGEQAMLQFVPERSKPRKLRVASLPKEQKAIVKAMRTCLVALNTVGLKGINLYNCWMARRLAPLRERGHLMCEYQGKTTRRGRPPWSGRSRTIPRP